VRLRVFDFAPDGLGGGTALLEGSNFPFFTSPSAIVIRSSSAEGQPVIFGDGLRCVALPGLVRLGATAAAGGISNHPISHGADRAFHYQIWYPPADSYCNSSAAFNLSSAYTHLVAIGSRRCVIRRETVSAYGASISNEQLVQALSPPCETHALRRSAPPAPAPAV
jgi:hypothetical protein